MKLKFVFTGIVLSFLFSCNNQGNILMDSNVINVEHALQNLITLKVSDFGKTVRFIPLETTDNCLVGNRPTVKVLKNYIVVENREQRNCLLFDKKDGRFIAEIGSFGQGPQDYTDQFSWTDEKEEYLYFKRQPNQLLQFDMKGILGGNIRFASPPGLATTYLLTEFEAIGYFGGIRGIGGIGGIAQANQFALGIFDKEGNLKDTIPQLLSKLETNVEGIASISVISGYNRVGILSNGGGIIIIDDKNDKRQFFSQNASRIWKNNENIRFKEDCVDTIYTYSNNNLIPSFIFNTGKYYWSAQEIKNKSNSDGRIFTSYVSENNTHIFFQCISGLFADEPVLYHGLFNKQTGVTKIGKHNDGIEDDLTRFMPFIPLGMSSAGELFSLAESWSIMEWLENHPEALKNEKLPFLNKLDEEMNPIVVLIE